MSNIDQKTSDLSVKNPNKVGEVAMRDSKDILEEISKLDKESEAIINSIKQLM